MVAKRWQCTRSQSGDSRKAVTVHSMVAKRLQCTQWQSGDSALNSQETRNAKCTVTVMRENAKCTVTGMRVTRNAASGIKISDPLIAKGSRSLTP